VAGRSQNIVTKRPFNFDQLTAGQSESQVAVKAIDVSAYREGMLVVRAHTRDIVNASSIIEVQAFVTAPSSEDPSVDWVASAALATATITNGSTAFFITANLANMGGFLRIVVKGTRISSGNCNANISIDLVLKE
jgi:hypothetical protein